MPIPPAKTCRICGKPLTLHEQFAGGLCGDWRCRWRHLDAELRAHRKEAAAALGEAAAESFPIAVVPFRSLPIVPLPCERRQELAQFLAALVQELPASEGAGPASLKAATPAAAAEASGAAETLAARLCAVCRGFCCFFGGARHAFIDGETVANLAARRPGVPPARLVAEFLSYLPERHYQGSCLFHGEAGCTLPRAMRARICNAYECRGLKDARDNCGAAGVARSFVVVRHDNRIVRSAFVDALVIRGYGDA